MPLLDNIWAMMTVWVVPGYTVGNVLDYIVYHVHSFIYSFIIDQIKSDAFTVYRFRGTEQIKTTSKNYDEINASSKVVGK